MELEEKERTNRDLHHRLYIVQEQNKCTFFLVVEEFIKDKSKIHGKIYNMDRIHRQFYSGGLQELMNSYVVFSEFPEWYEDFINVYGPRIGK